MLTKNLTPFLVGTKVTSRRPPQPEMTVIVRGTWKLTPGEPLTVVEGLDQGFLTAEVYREEDEDRRGEALYGGDFADYKLNAEVMLTGSCHAPRGAPIAECLVRFSVGAWSKALRVVGPRAWSDRLSGARASEPLRFTKMPLDFAHAFGGPRFAKNPVGKGAEGTELPNVEDPAQPIKSPADRPPPASFAPVSPSWPDRALKWGTQYGKVYRDTRAPFYAEDFDWSFFSAAPADQQIKGFLRGDEEISFINLHSKAHTFSARLPGLRVRAFVEDVKGRFREQPMSLDTLFVELDKEHVHLTWRGVGEVREQDLVDVAYLLVASEPLASEPLPEAHYLDLLRAFAKDPTGVLAAMPDGLIEAGDARKRQRAGEAPPKPAVTSHAPDPVSGALQAQFGKLLRPADSAKVAESMAATKATAGPAKSAELESAIKTALASPAAESPPMPMPLKPGTMPSVRLKEAIRGVMAKVAEMKKAAADQGQELKGIEALEAFPHDPRLKQLDPAYAPPSPLSTDEPGPGRNLADRDLRGLDLRGMDLSAAILEGADLSGADLSGARLVGANLRYAVLFETVLTGADLSGADLSFANAANAKAKGAAFTDATLEQAFFDSADLEGADLTRARGEYVVFAKVNLEGAKASKAELPRSDFTEANLARADLRGAQITGCAFIRCAAGGIDLSNARIAGANFSEADLTGARADSAHGMRCFFMKTRLDGADFTLAWLVGSHFTEASAVGARFWGANLRECRFYRASLERAEVVQANLFSADLCKAKLSGARFTSSNLYDAKLLDASGSGCDFMNANLKRSTLERS
jgi:uncharacterized protein YjbI with pentapeptide repeats